MKYYNFINFYGYHVSLIAYMNMFVTHVSFIIRFYGNCLCLLEYWFHLVRFCGNCYCMCSNMCQDKVAVALNSIGHLFICTVDLLVLDQF
jgi:hypothetical protein